MLIFLPLSFVESGAKNLNGGCSRVLIELEPIFPTIVWDAYKDSDITVRLFNSIAMKKHADSSATACFCFIVKAFGFNLTQRLSLRRASFASLNAKFASKLVAA